MRGLILWIMVALMAGATGFPESYYAITKSEEQKEAFGAILKPLVEKTNKEILAERAFVRQFFQTHLANAFRDVPEQELSRLATLRKKYRVEALYDREEYLRRIDIIPISLALAQGAIESGWGKSRFVREANNIFGHWTWGEKGLVPLNRAEGMTHRIRIFDSLKESVDAYALNLNRHYAYEMFREERARAHQQQKAFGGTEAAKTMIYYSEIREKYVEMLKKAMQDNGFHVYDKPRAPLFSSLRLESVPLLAR
ncbi:glucosaminidase domain-containing protein [Sulfurospirillum sp. T05]|uniref:Glucosaminidase domain-containing protein n=1 Tax=Sulfurospirillum tamanense TaxID=2813362 RepID=A0ABS2WR86_9BACT|nr:glucosaminidase domain-containing protein [Sulfurospirillum tamanensis]MBN2964050.1 glucosaminidase domain-containing protein [Sulfurospirillum tamanensis]